MKARFVVAGCCLWLSLSAVSLLSQSLQIRTYGISDGLPQSQITTIYQDRQNYLWFGTRENGLARYDGRSMKPYSRDQGLMHPTVRAILQDQSGKVWVGTDGGLSCIVRDSIVTFTTDNGLPSNQISCLVQDAAETMWIGTRAGLCRWIGDAGSMQLSNPIDSSSAVLFQTVPLSSNRIISVRSVVVSPNNKLWVGTNDGVYLVEVSGQSPSPESQLLSGHSVTSLLLAGDGALWAGTTNGLFRFEDGRLDSYNLTKGLYDQRILCLGQDFDDNLWIGTRTGLLKYDGSRFVLYGIRHGLPSPYIRSLLVDYEGNIWLGTWGGGVAKIHGWYIENYTRENVLPVDPVVCFLQDQRERVWIGTYGGGLAILDGDSATILDATNVLPHDYVFGISQSASGDIWVATRGGAARLRAGKWRRFTRENGMPGVQLGSVFCADNGEIWFGSFDAGAIIYRNGRFRQLSQAEGLPSNMVHQVFQDRRGRMWIATQSGLFMRDQDDSKTFGLGEGLPDSAIVCIFEDHAGTMWFGTRSGGAARYQEGEFKVYNTSNGLPNNIVYFIGEDAQQRLWFGTNAGVACYDGNEFSYLRTYNGLANDECNARAVMLDRAGYMWFGTVGGASRLDPRRFPATSPPPRVVVAAVEAGKKVYSQYDDLNCRAKSGTTINFKFETLSFINEDKTDNLVFLEGFDDDWIDLGNRRSIRYTNLPPGRYTFHVRGRNALGIKSQNAATARLEILPPFYQTYWFIGLSLMTVVSLVYFGHRYRVKHMEERARELEQAVAEKTARIEETHAFVSTVKESLPLGLLVVDANRFVVDANQAAVELFGYPAEELRGQELHNLLSSPILNREAIWQALQNKHGVELVGLSKDARHVVCQIHSDCVMDNQGQLRFVVLTCEDIEERKRLEAKLIENEKQLALVDLMAGMGDVLDSKLAGVRDSVELLKNELARVGWSGSSTTIERAQSSIRDMDQVLRQLVEYGTYLVKAPEVSTDLASELKSLAERWRDELTIHLPDTLEPVPVKIVPMFKNALNEAIRNSFEAEARNVNIDVEVLWDASRVRLIFTDDGTGVPPESIAKVFLPFFKTKGAPHSGLGLWKLNQVVKQCGGSVGIVALPKRGTQLRVTIPLEVQPAKTVNSRTKTGATHLVR